jgi:hypothetical protein
MNNTNAEDAPDSEQGMLEDIRKGLRESVVFWGPDKKLEREAYVVRTFLEHLRIEFTEAEVLPETSEPPDIRFRDARFEIKEMLDEGRKRHLEYREKLKKAEAATSLRQFGRQYTPKELTFQEIGEHVVRILERASNHYASRVIQSLDLLIYANLLECHVVLDSPVPNASLFADFGWRSVSVTRGSVACVLCAREDAPRFLLSHMGMPMVRIVG